MMYRSGWAQKANQEIVLAIRLPRPPFDALVRDAVASHFDPDTYSDREAWRRAVDASDVRVQWDPDRDPQGNPLERRAIQLGLRRTRLPVVTELPLEVIDVTGFVRDQSRALTRGGAGELLVPVQRVYELSEYP